MKINTTARSRKFGYRWAYYLNEPILDGAWYHETGLTFNQMRTGMDKLRERMGTTYYAVMPQFDGMDLLDRTELNEQVNLAEYEHKPIGKLSFDVQPDSL
jgi:hypothetical protein